MELLFLAILVLIMAVALGSGYPVAFALPGAAIITISLAAATGYVFEGNTDAYFHSGGPSQWLSAGVTNLRGVYWDVDRDTLIAIPLFIFMGIMLQRSKIAEDLLVTMAQLFGPIPGGLGISVVFVGALLAATTGIVGATVVAMGLISLPAMLRNNYSKPLATGTIAASGTLGQIIPPSIVLIILADQLASATDQASTARKALHKESTGELSMPSAFDVASTSAGEMFLGAFLPGLVLVGLYMAYILISALLRPNTAPAVPYEGDFDGKFWGKVALTLIPPLALIFLVLGSIIAGIATVNQAGAIGAAGALVMAGYRLTEGSRTTYYPAILAIIALAIAGFALSNYPMNVKAIRTSSDSFGIFLGAVATVLLLAALAWSGWRALKIEDTLRGVMIETAKTTSLVFIILLGAAMLTAAFRAFGGEELVRDFLTSLPGGFWTQFIIVMAVIFILGFFLDFIEIAVVVVPIVAPILLMDPGANITAVWLGVMIGLNIQTSFLTPPFGFALFYLRGVAPAVVKTLDMYKGVIAFICLQLLALFIVGFYPQLVNYLPNRVSFLSETSPPPRNPKLQICLEEYVISEIQSDGDRLKSAIAKVKSIDLTVLPKREAKSLTDAFALGEELFTKYPKIGEAVAAVEDASGEFRPLHRQVRSIEARMRKHDAEIKDMKTALSRAKGRGDTNAAERSQASIDAETAARDELATTIPAEWKDKSKAFVELTKAEAKARSDWRRSADKSYEPIAAMITLLDGAADLEAIGPAIDALEAKIADGDAEELQNDIKALTSQISAANGDRKIGSPLAKIRRALRKKPDERDGFAKFFEDSRKAYQSDLAWKLEAAKAVLPGLKTYEAEIRDTFGIRLQQRLPREHALYIASCSSGHRDISLNF
ncbi:MAG: TRAP transporter large permease subunit [Pseudomonadota bacterium]